MESLYHFVGTDKSTAAGIYEIIIPMSLAKYLMVGFLVLIQSFEGFFSVISLMIIFTESIAKPKILLLCDGAT